MNIELSEDDLPLVIRALDHYHAYTCAAQREDHRYKALAERLTAPPKKEAVPERRTATVSKRRVH